MKDTVDKAIFGVSGITVGFAISKATIIAWLQITSLMVGIAVGVASFVSICLSIRRKRLQYLEMRKRGLIEEETTTI